MKPSGLGVSLAALNVLCIAIGMAGMEGAEPGGIILLVMIFGMVPAVVLGACLGWIAGIMKSQPVWLRRLVLVVPAVLLVALLGQEFDLERFVAVSCIPTAVCVLILERNTRFVAPPVVPPAHVV